MKKDVVERERDDTPIDVLRAVLRRMRDDKQGGYADVGPDGKFAGTASYVSTSLSQVTPAELDALFELAGFVPDPIKVNGHCADCVHGDTQGGDLGWAQPR